MTCRRLRLLHCHRPQTKARRPRSHNCYAEFWLAPCASGGNNRRLLPPVCVSCCRTSSCPACAKGAAAGGSDAAARVCICESGSAGCWSKRSHWPPAARIPCSPWVWVVGDAACSPSHGWLCTAAGVICGRALVLLQRGANIRRRLCESLAYSPTLRSWRNGLVKWIKWCEPPDPTPCRGGAPWEELEAIWQGAMVGKLSI